MAENYEIMIDEVDSLIRDENICVTYKFLCRHFSLKTVTEGRKLLLKCAEREGGREFMKTYLIGGIKCNESDPDAPVVNEYCLVRSENLDDAKSKFSKLTTSNLYSLQMSKIEDWNSLYTADLTEDENCIINASRASHIKYSKAENSRQIESSQVVEDAVIPQIASSISDGSNAKPATSKLKTRAPEVKQKSVAANAAKGSLKNMFMAQAVKKSTDKSSVVSNDVKVKKEFNSIENLCGDKQNSVNKIANEDEKKKNEKGHTKDDKCANKQEISTVPSDKTKSNVRKHKKLASKKDSEPNKKRRRIIAVSDSSSNESDDSNNSCDIMETEDILEEELQKPKPTVCRSPSPNGVRKKRKLVEETVVDDNGYLVTKKKWEHVSDSDEAECEKEEVKPVISAAETKKKSPLSSKEVVAGKNKQAVLTSFFLRKS